MGWSNDAHEAYSGEVTNVVRLGHLDGKTYQTRAPLTFHIPSGWKGKHVSIMTYGRFLYSLKPGYIGGTIRLRHMRLDTTPPDGTAQTNYTLLRQGVTQLDLRKQSTEYEWIVGNHFWHGLLAHAMQQQLQVGPEFATFGWGTCYMKVWD